MIYTLGAQGLDEFALRSEACNGHYVGVKDGKLKLVDSYYPWNFENVPTAPWKEAMVNMIAACGRVSLPGNKILSHLISSPDFLQCQAQFLQPKVKLQPEPLLQNIYPDLRVLWIDLPFSLYILSPV